MSFKEINEYLRNASKIIDYQVTSRGLLESQLFPVTAYISLSFYNSYDMLYPILKKVSEKISPEDLGKSGRKILSEIHGLSLFYIPLYYLSGRMGIIYHEYEGDITKEPIEKRKEAAWVIDFWKRCTEAYYNNGKLTAFDSGFKHQSLNQDDIDWTLDKIKPITDEQKTLLKKTMANLEMAAFIDECEARAKLNDHGPYEIGDNEVLVFKEIMHLYDGKDPHFYWSETSKPAPYSNIAFVLRLKNMEEIKIDDFATMTTIPEDYTENITGYALLTRVGSEIKVLDFEILEDFEAFADQANTDYFLRFTEWDREKRLRAGAYAYYYGYARYTNQVGITDQIKWELTPYIKENCLPRFLEDDFDESIERYFRGDEDKDKEPTMYLLAEEE